MRYFILILCLSITFSSLAVKRKFIRAIDYIELSFDKNLAWRGNTITIDLNVILNTGEIHACSNSSQINLNDFDFSFVGDGKIIKTKRRKVLIELSKELNTNENLILATLKKDETISYTYKIEIIDFRKQVSSLAIVSKPIDIYPDNTVPINVKSIFMDGNYSETLHETPKLYVEDFDYEVSGAAEFSKKTGVIKINDGYDPANNEVTITATLKENPSIQKVQTYQKHFNYVRYLGLYASSGKNGDDGNISSGKNGSDGDNYDSQYLDGESGENGKDGDHGYNGEDGRNGRNVNIYIEVVNNDPNNIILKTETIDEFGHKYIQHIGAKGTLKVDISGGDGGNGGDGRDGGNGGDGGKGKSDYGSDEKKKEEGYGGHGGNGGYGGWGGNGGYGGNGGDANIFYTEEAAPYIKNIIVYNHGGNGGRAGDGGDGGRAGDKGCGGLGCGEDGKKGEDGRDGEKGRNGSSGYITYNVWK